MPPPSECSEGTVWEAVHVAVLVPLVVAAAVGELVGAADGEAPRESVAVSDAVAVALGEGVTHLKIGQRVLASIGWGGMAEKVAAEAARVVPIPDAMPFDEAASLLITYGTTYYALKNRAHLRPGESLLVLGAAGGVGSAAVELGKAMGARVIAAASSEDKVEAARGWGADAGVVYPRGPFDRDGQKKLSELFKSACGAAGADAARLGGRVDRHEHDVGLADVLVRVGGEEQVAAAAGADDLLEPGLVDRELVRVPRVDAGLVDVDDDDGDVGALEGDHGHRGA